MKYMSCFFLKLPLLISKVHMQVYEQHPATLGLFPKILFGKFFLHILPKNAFHLQYCQKVKCTDIGVFPSLKESPSTNQSFLFFPALCNVDKSQVTRDETSSNSNNIGWLALCTDIHDYFPSRFLHVLLLRLVYAFTLSVPTQLQIAHSSPGYSRRCTMWKRGVHWLMGEGVDCMVEMVRGNQGVVVLTKSINERMENCIGVFNRIISCVMEAKAEFCYSIKPQFFLLDSTAEADYFNEDKLFAMSDVESAFACPEGNNIIISVSGKGHMERSKLSCMHKLTHWNSLFPIDFSTVLDCLKDIVKELYELGENLGAPRGILQGIEADFSSNVKRRRRELVRWWMSSSPDPPCWWLLVKALKGIDENALAEKIKSEHSESLSKH